MILKNSKWNYFIYTVVCFIILSCKEEKKNIYFNHLDSPYNIFDLTPTDFVFEKEQIYSMSIPAKTSLPTYLKNYFIIEDDTLKFIRVREYCETIYCDSVSYLILRDYKNISEPDGNDECDVYLSSFLPLNLKVGDTVYYYLNKLGIEKTDRWVTLERKFYDKKVNDTIYRFYVYNHPKINNYYYFTKQIGFIGITTSYEGYIEDSIGYPFNNQTSEMELYDIGLEPLKCFLNVSER